MIYVLLGSIHLLVNFLREMARFSMTLFCNDFDRPCIIQYKYEIKCFKHTRFCQELSEVKIMVSEIIVCFFGLRLQSYTLCYYVYRFFKYELNLLLTHISQAFFK